MTAEAIGYAMNQWQALIRYLDDGRIEIDNNAAHAASGISGNVIKGTASAIHADDNARAFEYICEGKTRKLRTLIAVEYFGRAMVA